MNTSAGSFWHEKNRIFDLVLFASVLIFTLIYILIQINIYFILSWQGKRKKISTTTKTVMKLKTKKTKNILLILHGYSWQCHCFFLLWNKLGDASSFAIFVIWSKFEQPLEFVSTWVYQQNFSIISHFNSVY